MSVRIHALVGDLRDGIRAQPGRAILVFLAVWLGTAALTALLAVTEGLGRQARGLVRRFGADAFEIARIDGGEGIAPALADTLRGALPSCGISGIRIDRAPERTAGGLGIVAAVEPAFFNGREPPSAGRWLDAEDLADARRVAVADRGMAEARHLFPGALLTVGEDSVFRVVGIAGGDLSDAPGGVETATAGILWVPLSVRPFWQDGVEPRQGLDRIRVHVPPAWSMEKAAARVRSMLQRETPGGDRYTLVTPATLMARVAALRRELYLTAGSLIVLCLALAGATLSSLLIANVRSRTQEIGVRRALGALPSDVAMLFAAEACLLTACAGLAGTGAVWGVLQAGAGRWALPMAMNAWTLAVPPVSALLLGAAASAWPAFAAARLPPSVALKNE